MNEKRLAAQIENLVYIVDLLQEKLIEQTEDFKDKAATAGVYWVTTFAEGKIAEIQKTQEELDRAQEKLTLLKWISKKEEEK